MATIINNPSSGDSSESSGVGVVVGVLVAILLVAVFIIFGLPALRSQSAPEAANSGTGSEINVDVNLPEGGGEAAEAEVVPE